MAWSFLINFSPATGGEAVWKLKEELVSRGWAVARSGSGSGGAFNAAGDVHAPGGPYAGTLDLAGAWLELRQPVAATPRRSFLLQTPNTNGNVWRIWYSSDGVGFTGGAPNATTRGTATDEQGLANTPTGTTAWLPTNNTYNTDLIVGDTDEGFSFFWAARVRYDSAYATVLSLDVLEDAHVLDQDSSVVGVHWPGAGQLFARAGTSNMYANTTASQTASCSRGWYRKGLSGAAFLVYPFVFWGGGEGAPSIIPLNSDRQTQADDGTIRDMVIWYWRGSSTFTTERGYKGKSRLFRTSQDRYAGSRLNLGRTRLSLGVVSVPWDGTSIPSF